VTLYQYTLSGRWRRLHKNIGRNVSDDLMICFVTDVVYLSSCVVTVQTGKDTAVGQLCVDDKAELQWSITSFKLFIVLS